MPDPREEIRIRYPQTLKEFETIQKEMLYLFCEKQLDSRFLNLTMQNKKPNNESIDDTLIDIANYAVMALIVRSKLWGK